MEITIDPSALRITLSALAPMMCKDPERSPYMRNIWWYPMGPGGVTFCASNGHLMGRVVCTATVQDESSGQIPGAQLAGLLATLKGTTSPSARITRTGIQVLDHEIRYPDPGPPVDYRKVLAPESDPNDRPGVIGYNPEYLAMIGDFARALCERENYKRKIVAPHVAFHVPRSALDAATFAVSGAFKPGIISADVTLMPVRL